MADPEKASLRDLRPGWLGGDVHGSPSLPTEAIDDFETPEEKAQWTRPSREVPATGPIGRGGAGA